MKVICPYCNKEAELVCGKRIYPHRKDLYHKNFWLCGFCGSYVGCHPGTSNPLGRLANSELRKAKMRAHAAFDPIWKSGEMSRKDAYEWLAFQLEIEPVDCHIGMFDTEMCERVVEVCEG